MMKRVLLIMVVLSLCACSGIRLVSPYDEVIDKGVIEFAEQFNTHVKNMGDLSGTQEGTYEANLKTYNALDSKLDVLIARASAASEGKGCKVEQKLYEQIKKMLQNDIPPDIKSDTSTQTGNTDGCNERLLVLVKDQLETVRKIHKETDKCSDKKLSCIRPASAKTALKIANQSINAVSIVETAKKK